MSFEERQSEVADAAEALREQVDVLLDRAADRVLKIPAAGSASWHATWRNRQSEDGQMQLRQHLLIRISVAQLLGLDTASDVRAALTAGATTRDVAAVVSRKPPSTRSGRSSRLTAGQLHLFDEQALPGD